MREFHFEDEDGNVIKWEKEKLRIWISHNPLVWPMSREDTARFVAWAINHGVKSAVTYCQSGEMFGLNDERV